MDFFRNVSIVKFLFISSPAIFIFDEWNLILLYRFCLILHKENKCEMNAITDILKKNSLNWWEKCLSIRLFHATVICKSEWIVRRLVDLKLRE